MIDKDIGERETLPMLTARAKEYHELSLEERQELVTRFDEEKENVIKATPGVTTWTLASEISASFAACVEEVCLYCLCGCVTNDIFIPKLNAMHQRHGIEALLVVVRGSHRIKMEPCIHMTSESIVHFIRTATSHDPMVFRMKMEIAALAGEGMDSKCLMVSLFISIDFDGPGISLNYKDHVAKAKNTITSGLLNDLGKSLL